MLTPKQISVFLFACLMSGCSEKIDDDKCIRFGGEIINPKNNRVVLYSSDFHDTLTLTNNQFFASYDSLPPQIYYFRHGPEVQWVFLESGDSVILRLNTNEFDESLTFSGIGAEKNNFLIDYFLERERNTFNPYSSTILEEDEFIKIYDSCYSARNKLLDDFLSSNQDESEYSKKMLNGFVQFPFYTVKEFYPYNFTKSHNLFEYYKPKTPNFYSHREKIDLNDEDLHNLRSFFQYVQYYLYNEALTRTFNSCKKLHDTIYEYAQERLYLIIDKISNSEFKDRLLLEGIHELQFKNQSGPINQFGSLIEMYKENISNDQILKTADESIYLYNASLPGQKLKNLPIYNLNNEKVDLLSFQVPLQIIFWRCSPLEYLHQINFDLIKSEFKLPPFRTIFVLLDSEYKYLAGEFKSRVKKEEHYFSKQLDSIELQLYLYNSPQIYLLDKNLTILSSVNKERRNKLTRLLQTN